MTLPEVLRRQWEGYPRYHRGRANLLLHAVLVPLFLAGNVTMLVALLERRALLAVAGAAATVLSIALQGRGHGREAIPPEPFRGPLDAVARIFGEQWITFPRFVLSGGWLAALRATRAPSPGQEESR